MRKSAPIKLDIGAVFNARPSLHKSLPAPLVPTERELVFDIDLTDYDNVRSCCKKTAVCQKCFSFATIAVKVIDDLLRCEFGFRRIFWVFSGRRGVHCWVCDSNARNLSNVERSAIADFLSVSILKSDELTMATTVTERERSGEKKNSNDYARDKSSLWSKLHPSMDRVYNRFLLPCFEKIIVEEQLDFNSESFQSQLLRDFPEEVAAALREEFKLETTNSFKWKKFKVTCYLLFQQGVLKKTNPIIDIVFKYVYPRLDLNVSKSINHLLKSPFVVHPATGKQISNSNSFLYFFFSL